MQELYGISEQLWRSCQRHGKWGANTGGLDIIGETQFRILSEWTGKKMGLNSKTWRGAAIPETDLVAAAFERVKRKLDDESRASFLEAFYADQRVTRMIVKIAFEANLRSEYEIDEVRQNVAMLLHTKWLDEAVRNAGEKENVYGLLYALTFNAFRTMKKTARASEFRTTGLDVDVDGEPATHGEGLIDESTVDVVNEIDLHRAQHELMRRLGLTKNAHLLDRTTTKRLMPGVEAGETISVRREAVRSTAPSVAQELVDIRDELGLSNADYAAALGVIAPTLSSYMYGRVRDIPSDVIDNARQMLKAANPASLERRRWVEKSTMSEVLQSWVKMLDLGKLPANEQDKAVAQVLGCNTTTVWRWRQNTSKPLLNTIMVYEGVVKRHAGVA